MRSILWKTVANVLTSAGISALAAAILVVPNSGSRTFASTGPGTTNVGPPPPKCQGGQKCRSPHGFNSTSCKPTIMLQTKCYATGCFTKALLGGTKCTGCHCNSTKIGGKLQCTCNGK